MHQQRNPDALHTATLLVADGDEQSSFQLATASYERRQVQMRTCCCGCLQSGTGCTERTGPAGLKSEAWCQPL